MPCLKGSARTEGTPAPPQLQSEEVFLSRPLPFTITITILLIWAFRSITKAQAACIFVVMLAVGTFLKEWYLSALKESLENNEMWENMDEEQYPRLRRKDTRQPKKPRFAKPKRFLHRNPK
jgi:hypothetical protein